MHHDRRRADVDPGRLRDGGDPQPAPANAMRLEGIEGHVAMVTGASSGIGAKVADTLQTLGARVVGLDLAPASGVSRPDGLG